MSKINYHNGYIKDNLNRINNKSIELGHVSTQVGEEPNHGDSLKPTEELHQFRDSAKKMEDYPLKDNMSKDFHKKMNAVLDGDFEQYPFKEMDKLLSKQELGVIKSIVDKMEKLHKEGRVSNTWMDNIHQAEKRYDESVENYNELKKEYGTAKSNKKELTKYEKMKQDFENELSKINI